MGDGLSLTARLGAPFTASLGVRARAFVATSSVDVLVVSCATVAALAFGLANTAVPSFWHDELVHVFVGRHIADMGKAILPSGMPYYNGTTFHGVLAVVYEMFGSSEATMRAPSAIFAAINVVLTYLVLRPILGRSVALAAAVGMALSPWNVAWSRQARFYTLHQGLYIGFIGLIWEIVTTTEPRRVAVSAVAALLTFAAGVLTSFHALIFLAAPGLFALGAAVSSRTWRSRWSVLVFGMGGAGLTGIGLVRALMNPVDRVAVIDNGGLGGGLVFPERSYRLYYLDWLGNNLSTGFLALAVIGSVWMVARERREGAYAALAFWAPFAVLTFLIGYRWPKFLFFAYPFYIAAWAYALVRLVAWLAKPKPDWPRRLAAAGVALLLLRLGVSAVRLTADSVEAASGANTTLATRHPQWRDPCQWVRDRLEDNPNAVVIATTALPVYFYVGEIDQWYPSRALPAEREETGLDGLATVDDLAAFVRDYPNGYFIAEWWRFERNYKGAPWADFSEDIAWVQSHMRRVDVASTEDVTVYAWGEVDDK